MVLSPGIVFGQRACQYDCKVPGCNALQRKERRASKILTNHTSGFGQNQCSILGSGAIQRDFSTHCFQGDLLWLALYRYHGVRASPWTRWDVMRLCFSLPKCRFFCAGSLPKKGLEQGVHKLSEAFLIPLAHLSRGRPHVNESECKGVSDEFIHHSCPPCLCLRRANMVGPRLPYVAQC